MNQPNFVPIRRLTVRREFNAGGSAGELEVRRDCGLGCTCGATMFRAGEPRAELAERPTYCMNHGARKAISELPGTARQVPADAGVTAFELDADLVTW